MEHLPKQIYAAEFRAEAIKLVVEQGLSLAEAARRLSIPKGSLQNWVAKARQDGLQTATRAKPINDLEAENARLRRELAEVKLERDILKKATAYFARESLPGTRS